MEMILERRIRGLVFDLDNTLYCYPENKNSIFAHAAARAALQMGAGMSFADAVRMAEQSYVDHESEAVAFCRAFDFDRKRFYHHVHEFGVEFMLQAIRPVQAYKEAFNRLSTALDVRILTHGSQRWAERLVAHLGYHAVLREDCLLGLDHPKIADRRKDQGPEVFEAVAGIMGLRPDEMCVVEDTLDNLIIPHQMGMQTVYVHWGKALPEKPAFVTAQVSDFTALA
jgi:putative hydrolase of the HAD superfamily